MRYTRNDESNIKQPSQRMRINSKLIMYKIIINLFIIGLMLFMLIILNFLSNLPSHHNLAKYNPSTVTRVYTKRGDLIAEYSKEYRIFIPYSQIPKIVLDAFIAAEDKNFFTHCGVDIISLCRATFQSMIHIAKRKRAVGASTITQQVVRSFLLSSDRNISRKIKEAILAYRINRLYTKEQIMELYLNQVFLGNKAYGVAAASKQYFSKNLDSLDLGEAALIAALPKAPSSLNPFFYPKRAKLRRDWVLSRMFNLGFITEAQLRYYTNKEIILHKYLGTGSEYSNTYAEAVRQELLSHFGEEGVYQKGLSVIVNMDTDLQMIADQILKDAIIEYDRRHGWRGPLGSISLKQDTTADWFVGNLGNNNAWLEKLKKYDRDPSMLEEEELAIVLDTKDVFATIGTNNGEIGKINIAQLRWARKRLDSDKLGPMIKKVSQVLKIGDIIVVKKMDYPINSPDGTKNFSLSQIPDVNGSIILLEPYTGNVVAMVGGYSFSGSKFNRALHAYRQCGSTFKSFVYLTALEYGIEPQTIIDDSPLKVQLGANLPPWEPKNYDDKFMGRISMRTALIKSRNIPTVRLTLAIGTDNIMHLSDKLGINDFDPNLSKIYSMALGARETTLSRMTNAYNIVASSGYQTIPKLVDMVYSRDGVLLYKNEQFICDHCQTKDADIALFFPEIRNNAPQLIEESSCKSLISMLVGVIQEGTGRRAKLDSITIAGKSGSTNNNFDTWFVAFSPDYTVGTYLGFDNPRSLGKQELGGSTAAPIVKKVFQKIYDKFRQLRKLENRPISLTLSPKDQENSIFSKANSRLNNHKAIEYDKLLNNKNDNNNEKDKQELPWLFDKHNCIEQCC